MANSLSQCEMILAHLRAGRTVTPAEGYTLFGTLALHRRINELRSKGHAIACELVDTPEGKTVGRYSLANTPQKPPERATIAPRIKSALTDTLQAGDLIMDRGELCEVVMPPSVVQWHTLKGPVPYEAMTLRRVK